VAGLLTRPYHTFQIFKQQARAVPAYPENEILVTPNATTSLLSTGMLDREKQAKKQQDTEYEEAGGRANNQLKSYILQYRAPQSYSCQWHRLYILSPIKANSALHEKT
jgi:hypothetical protein